MKWKKFFQNTKYIKLYFNIIEKAIIENRIFNSKIHERHHILPRSLFPEYKNDKKNLVILSFREHFICHALLWKHYKKIGDKNAIIKTGHVLVKLKYFYLTGRKYEMAKKAQAESRLLEGSTITEEGRRRISLRMKEKNPAKELKLCPYCKKEIPLNNYYQYHGEYCKYNPDRKINQTVEQKWKKIGKKLKNKRVFINCFTFKKEIIKEKNPKWYHVSKNNNDYVWVIYKNNKILHIFCNTHSAEHFLKKFNRTIWFLKENIKRYKIYSKNNFKNKGQIKRYYISYFEGCEFKQFKIKDLNSNFFENNKEKIYKKDSDEKEKKSS